jgi:vacuolar protein 8
MKSDAGAKLGMPEQAAITLADIAYKNVEMQKAIVEAGAVPALLAFIRTGSQLGQEHAARAIWHLAALFDVHSIIIEAGGIPDLVQLLKMGSPRAQEMATAGISDLALGAVQERLAAGEQEAKEKLTNTAAMDCELAGVGQLEPDDQEEETCNDRLTSIAKAGVVVPLVALLSSGTAQARENTASALWHLAFDGQIRLAIAKCGGISPLVAILDDGTEQARAHAANALARLATENEDSQSQIAKNCVGLLGNKKTGTQRRAARVISDLASGNPGSPVLIVNAGAISPLVNLLSGGAADVKEEVARALNDGLMYIDPPVVDASASSSTQDPAR